MEENIYQNIDLTNNNPLKVDEKPQTTFIQKLKTDRKIQLLVGLSSFTFLLLIVALIVSSTRNSVRRGDITTNLPTPIATPTIINQANVIPTKYQPQFDNIELLLKYNPEIAPPQIDPNLGN